MTRLESGESSIGRRFTSIVAGSVNFCSVFILVCHCLAKNSPGSLGHEIHYTTRRVILLGFGPIRTAGRRCIAVLVLGGNKEAKTKVPACPSPLPEAGSVRGERLRLRSPGERQSRITSLSLTRTLSPRERGTRSDSQENCTGWRQEAKTKSTGLSLTLDPSPPGRGKASVVFGPLGSSVVNQTARRRFGDFSRKNADPDRSAV